MTAIVEPQSASDPSDDALLAHARELGFELVSYESAAGQLIFEWRRGDEPRPQFVTRRVALLWMEEFLAGSELRVS
jgi:hypothetical protein